MAPDKSSPVLLVLMGVSGAGKSTIGRGVATALGFEFVEADDFHSDQAKARMARGKPLDDAMRSPWIESITQYLLARLNRRGLVLAFSGLRAAHRQSMRQLGFHVLYFHLCADPALLRRRLEDRKDHFASANLLHSQFDALQEPQSADVISVDVDRPPEAIVELIQAHYQSRIEGTHDCY